MGQESPYFYHWGDYMNSTLMSYPEIKKTEPRKASEAEMFFETTEGV